VATYSFPGGQITGQALIVPGDPAPYAVAITGGSGKYRAPRVRSASSQSPTRGGPERTSGRLAWNSLHQPTVEAAIAAAGFQVVRRERIASEWSEYQLEHDPGYLTQDLLEIARLTRNRDQAEAALGSVWYQRALAFASWRLQIVLGRLMPVLYALSKPATGDTS
jgi:hypothetical protein